MVKSQIYYSTRKFNHTNWIKLKFKYTTQDKKKNWAHIENILEN